MVPIAMKNYQITASNGVVRCTSTANFIPVKYDFIGIVQEGQSDVTTRTFLGLIWVWDAQPFHMGTRTTLGFQLLSVIVATGYESRKSAIMRLDHEESPITRT